MQESYIKAISYYLPERILTNEELVEEFPEWTVEKVAQKVGVKERHISADNETATEMGIKAAEQLFSEHNLEKSNIDFLLFCTQSPDHFLPTSACIIQHSLGLSTSCGALDYNLGCSGYVYGLSLAKGLIAGGIAKNVLLITAETYTKHIHTLDKGNKTIFADAAAATFISTDGFAKIGDFVLGTDGAGANNLIVPNGAMKSRACNIVPNNSEGFYGNDYLYMNGGDIFNFTSDAVPVLVEQLLSKHSFSQDDIDLFVFHQANRYMMNYLRKLIGIDSEKFYVYLEKVGNTVSSTIPIALYNAQKEGKLKGNILLAGFGVGYSWGGTILNIEK